jgi:hypothetical protein
MYEASRKGLRRKKKRKTKEDKGMTSKVHRKEG